MTLELLCAGILIILWGGLRPTPRSLSNHEFRMRQFYRQEQMRRLEEVVGRGKDVRRV